MASAVTVEQVGVQALRRRTLYEIAELEEAQAEAAESWQPGALRQLRQLERAVDCAAAELGNRAG